MSARAIIVGIDEAGYGPVLGPLVVSAAAFEVPAERTDESLWDVLKRSVSRSARRRDKRVAILDSKKLYHRAEGLGPLERSALAAVTAWRGMPPDAGAFLRLVAPDSLKTLDAYTWYRGIALPLPRSADAGGVRLAAKRLREDAAEQGVRLAGLYCEPLPEAHYNRMVGGTRNKAVVLFALTTRLMQRIADAHPGVPLVIFADKQGARGHYGRMLRTAFEDRRLVIVEETATTSAYELRSTVSPWTIRFSQDGESQHLPVALASILSKYIREMFMAAFNAWWAEQVPGVRATAGYYQDGMRFVREVRDHLPRLGVELEHLVRRQ